ncbi:MAG: hypothetical protein A2Z08_06660 [Deltaproteobacteria bacterium RBG_16_54_11]|nr:MAG: hypothetical protein A2Z08_06660 [Deltaproteobacteria bacterium RBG_16_54_11]
MQSYKVAYRQNNIKIIHNIMNDLKIISQEANNLFRESFAECCRIRDEISALSDDTNNRSAIAKKNIMDSAQLSGQIIKALDSGSLLLALIGLRSLTENCINTKYTFAHPKKEREQLDWANQVCDDYFKRGNDPRALKSLLNEKNIKKRAKEVGLEELYEKDFASLCTYSHMQIQTAILNNQKYIEDFTRNAYVAVLTHLHNIRNMVQEHYNIKGWEKHSNRIVGFGDKYHSD